jgi:DNA primase
MLWLDKKFINITAPKLQLFKWKNDHLANVRCPFCGDSKKNKLKARGYFYAKGQDMFYRCHNCGDGRSLANFLKEFDNATYNQYIFETFRKDSEANTEPVIRIPTITFAERISERKSAEKIAVLPKEHYARQYLCGRQIPEKWFEYLEFTDNLQDFTLKYLQHPQITPNSAFILIPYKDASGKLIGYNSRSLSESGKASKYVKIKFDESTKLIFNRENVDVSKHIYVFEGEFNAMFVDNAVATGGVQSMRDIEKELKTPKENITLVVDRDRRNKEVVAALTRLIEDGYRVVLIPKNLNGKDVNDFVKNHKMNQKQIVELLEANTYSGLRAKLELVTWKLI